MKQHRGFTILEVILFLAISGVLTAMLLVGMGSAIQRQQYREAVQSYAGFVRGQYSRVINVQNDRLHGNVCPISGTDSGASSNRGQSECVILGRYIKTIDNTGSQYGAYPVYAAYTGSGWVYGLGDEDTSYSAQWSTKTRFADQDDGHSAISILMYRHPDMGNLVVRTDTNSYTNSNIGDFINSTDANLVGQEEICIYSTAWLATERNSVLMGARAGSSDSVTVVSSSTGCNDKP